MRQRRLKNEINVVPYIDVMLVLLVIFMVTAPMIQTGNIDLPSVGKSSQPPVAPMEVIVHADTSLYLRDRSKGSTKLKGIKELKAELAALKASDDKTPILIAGAKETQYKNVIEVLDEAKRAGFQKVGLETASK
jgi:biopolymer transport protein TolR